MIVAASPDAALGLVESALCEPGDARFGWKRRTLDALALELALPELARTGRSPLRSLGQLAVCARVVHELGEARELGRFVQIGDRPGFVRALASTLDELRANAIAADLLAKHDRELGRLLAAYEAALFVSALADRASVFAAAAELLRTRGRGLLPAAHVWLDVPLRDACEIELAVAISGQAERVFVSVARGDPESLHGFRRALGERTTPRELMPAGSHDLARLQRHLFDLEPEESPGLHDLDRVAIVSSPGESREAVEVARGILEAAEAGVAFDRMAIAVRAVENYRAVLEEALARAQIPAHFADGVRRPAPQGRAFNALLACASQGLSARRFAEYLSLSVVPEIAPATPSGPDASATPPARPVSPRRWEQLLVDASVVGGRARWERRLSGLARSASAERAALEADDPRRDTLERELAALAALQEFALPLLDRLAALPVSAHWGQWLTALRALARAALDDPERVCAVLDELAPLSEVGPVSLDQVRRLLAPRLASTIVPATGHGAGKVFVASIEELRGRSFERMFVTGLAERVFPPRVTQDPLLPDRVRAALGPSLALIDARVARERLALRLSVGAATERVVLSFPHFDVNHGRPRVPSFYGLEALQAIHGTPPAFDDLTRRAQPGAAARMGWPAPSDPTRAIDDAEYDLSLLDRWRSPSEDRIGAGRYLLEASPHLARSLRFRYRRWQHARFNAADGFVLESPEARALVSRHALSARPYSATALAKFADCPYQFYLHAIARLSERESIAEVDELDARQRGLLFHAIQRGAIDALRAGELLPLTEAGLPAGLELLARTFDAEVANAREHYAPAIDRVFDTTLRQLRLDLGEWLRRLFEARDWHPQQAELSFEARLAPGLWLRGAIDLVEAHADSRALRATDHKTGLPSERPGILEGGRQLQPVLYALALEQLFPEASVASGRLYYSTSRGEFHSHEVALDERSRASIALLIAGISEMLDAGFLPAAPDRGACERCAYAVICGPYEEQRVAIKQADSRRLEPLYAIRRLA